MQNDVNSIEECGYDVDEKDVCFKEYIYEVNQLKFGRFVINRRGCVSVQGKAGQGSPVPDYSETNLYSFCLIQIHM